MPLTPSCTTGILTKLTSVMPSRKLFSSRASAASSPLSMKTWWLRGFREWRLQNTVFVSIGAKVGLNVCWRSCVHYLQTNFLFESSLILFKEWIWKETRFLWGKAKHWELRRSTLRRNTLRRSNRMRKFSILFSLILIDNILHFLVPSECSFLQKRNSNLQCFIEKENEETKVSFLSIWLSNVGEPFLLFSSNHKDDI